VNDAIRALRAGQPVILPTDTVYGLCCTLEEDAARRMYDLKGRAAEQPTAVIFRNAKEALAAVPELSSRAARALFPGPFTVIVQNPGRRLSWITGGAETLGVRVPVLPPSTAEVLRKAGPVAATSANLPGGRDPRRIGDIPWEIQTRCAAVVDGGELPGVPSTIVDLTGLEPRILREGAVPAVTALALVRGAQ
jgi:L-threonylcarbamoyladenylate synthase